MSRGEASCSACFSRAAESLGGVADAAGLLGVARVSEASVLELDTSDGGVEQGSMLAPANGAWCSGNVKGASGAISVSARGVEEAEGGAAKLAFRWWCTGFWIGVDTDRLLACCRRCTAREPCISTVESSSLDTS